VQWCKVLITVGGKGAMVQCLDTTQNNGAMVQHSIHKPFNWPDQKQMQHLRPENGAFVPENAAFVTGKWSICSGKCCICDRKMEHL
jgi:hypothetical protein